MSMIQKRLVRFRGASGGEKGELKNEATPTMLLKTRVEKMSVLATPTIFMKTSNLSRDSHDIYETKGSCASGETERNRRISLRERKRPTSRKSQPDLQNIHANEMNASDSSAESTSEAGVSRAVARLRQASKKRYITFEAGMCMKTKDHKTQCPNRNRHLGRTFRHFCFIDAHFAEKCRF